MKEFISLDEAVSLDRKKVRDLYKDYVNPGLAGMMALLDFDKRFVRASGMELWDEDGNTYLDFLGSYGALNMGHNPPAIIKALYRIMENTPKMMQASLSPLAAALASNLSRITPGDLGYCFFCNSGTEAVEAALKLARACSEKSKILYCKNSFHGKSFGSLSVTGREKYRIPFQPVLPDCTEIEYDDLDAAETHMSAGDVAAIILEPVQGEGGVVVPREGYLKGIRELCDRYGVVMIADEIQTGMGRTGKYFACQHEDVVPDIMCIAKSLGGGMMPVGACISTGNIFKKAYGSMDKCLLHTSTFGGNALAMAAGIAALEVLVEEKLDRRAEEMGNYALEKLRPLKERYPFVRDIRGRGLIIGIEFSSSEGSFIDRLSKGAVSRLGKEYIGSLVAGELLNNYRIITAYTLNNPNVIRFEPPLIITREQIDYMVNSLERILEHNKNAFRMVLSGAKTAVKSRLADR